MFTKACLISIVALLTLILLNQRSPIAVHAQTPVQYKLVETNVFLTRDGKRVAGGDARDVRYFSTQDALNQYGNEGWQLVTAAYHDEGGIPSGFLIFTKK